MKPFLKWVGGKTQLLPHILPLLPKQMNHYIEPFLGGGAVFFALAAEWRMQSAVLSDANEELIACYRQVRDNPKALMNYLSTMPISEEEFYRVRALQPETLEATHAAARTIYLNKLGFNGLYRVNRKGGFNVPWGRHKNPALFDRDNLLECSAALQALAPNAEQLHVCAFSRTATGSGREWLGFGLDWATHGDCVYLDPPYVPVSATSNFTAYTAGGFGPEDQTWLARYAKNLLAVNVFVLLSNADTPVVRDLYPTSHWDLHVIPARRAVNSKGSGRGPVNELLIAPNEAWHAHAVLDALAPKPAPMPGGNTDLITWSTTDSTALDRAEAAAGGGAASVRGKQ